MNIQFYPDELDWVIAKEQEHPGSFLRAFLDACTRMDCLHMQKALRFNAPLSPIVRKHAKRIVKPRGNYPRWSRRPKGGTLPRGGGR